jgi:NAD(P)-dependent dehydrogenase (short-subunit alcohol dehydrogenase family)
VVSQDQWDAAVPQVKEQAGALHVLMNIVGSNALVRFAHIDIEEWNKLFETNVTGTLRGIQTCAPLMKDSGGGSIVNIGSEAGIAGGPGTAYSASMWAPAGPVTLGCLHLRRLGHPLQHHPAGLDRH